MFGINRIKSRLLFMIMGVLVKVVISGLLENIAHAATADFEFHLTAVSTNINMPTNISGTIHYDSTTAYLGYAFTISTITNNNDAYSGNMLLDNGGNLIFGSGAVAAGALTDYSLYFSFPRDPTSPGDLELFYLQTLSATPFPALGQTLPLDQTLTVMYAEDSSGAIPGSAQYYTGTITRVDLVHPPLTVAASGSQMILNWPAHYSGFVLEYATNFPSTNWTPLISIPASVGQQFVVTDSLSAGTVFYRLRK